METNKGFIWLPILLVILAASILGGGAYYFFEKASIPKCISTGCDVGLKNEIASTTSTTATTSEAMRSVFMGNGVSFILPSDLSAGTPQTGLGYYPGDMVLTYHTVLYVDTKAVGRVDCPPAPKGEEGDVVGVSTTSQRTFQVGGVTYKADYTEVQNGAVGDFRSILFSPQSDFECLMVLSNYGTQLPFATLQAAAQTVYNSWSIKIASSFTASPVSGDAPLEVRFDAVASAGDESIDFGDGQSVTTACPGGPEPDCATLHSPLGGIAAIHMYIYPGIYTAKLYRHMPTTQLGSLTINVSDGNPKGFSKGDFPSSTTTVRLAYSGFSFALPDGWRVFKADANTTGDGYILMNQRGGTITIQCPPVESNFKGFADLVGQNLAFQQQRVITHNGKTYTVSYAEYNPVTANQVGALIHISGGATPAEECKIGGTTDMSGVTIDQVWTSWEQEVINGLKQIYASWQ